MSPREIAEKNQDFLCAVLSFHGLDPDEVDEPSREETMSNEELERELEFRNARLPRDLRG